MLHQLGLQQQLMVPYTSLPTHSISRPPRRSASTVPPTLLARADEVIE